MNNAIADRVQQLQGQASQGGPLRIVPICGPSSDQPKRRKPRITSKKHGFELNLPWRTPYSS